MFVHERTVRPILTLPCQGSVVHERTVRSLGLTVRTVICFFFFFFFFLSSFVFHFVVEPSLISICIFLLIRDGVAACDDLSRWLLGSIDICRR